MHKLILITLIILVLIIYIIMTNRNSELDVKINDVKIYVDNNLVGITDQLLLLDKRILDLEGSSSAPMLGMGSPTWNSEVIDDTICSGSAMAWAKCQAGLGPTVPSNPETEQTLGNCFWGKNNGSTNMCVSSNSVKYTDSKGNLWAWIPDSPGCKTLCQPSSALSLHPEECTLSNDIHDLTNPSDPWGTCVSHPSLGYVGANCTGACGAGSTRTDCSGCVSDLGLFGDPFKNCRLLNRDNLVDDCKYNSEPTFPTHDWDYQFVPTSTVDGSGYHCVDVCTKQ